MNRNKKILNVTMAAGMAAVLGTTPVIAAAQEADNGVSKEETVYVNATAEGEIKDITVSDWLKNSGSAEGDVSDVSDLEGIKNVKVMKPLPRMATRLHGIQTAVIFIIRELPTRNFR